jgi:hypothetical protein
MQVSRAPRMFHESFACNIKQLTSGPEFYVGQVSGGVSKSGEAWCGLGHDSRGVSKIVVSRTPTRSMLNFMKSTSSRLSS